MKIVVLIVILFGSIHTHAQIYPGITSGYQIVSFKDKQQHGSAENGRGFRMGTFMDVPFPTTRFGARLEISYSFLSGLENVSRSQVYLHYLSVPVTFFYMPHPQIQVFVGPQVSVLLDRKSESSAVTAFEKTDFGMLGTMEFQFAAQWSVAFRYYQGLKYNTKLTATTSAASPYMEYKNRINMIQLGLNYFILKSPERRSRLKDS